MFDPEKVERIADAWVQFTKAAMDASERDSLAKILDEVDDMIQGDPLPGWAFIEAVRNREMDHSLLSNLAAGPLEDYLVVHGNTEIERLESLARQDVSLRHLLGQTWKNSMSDAIWERLQLAARSS